VDRDTTLAPILVSVFQNISEPEVAMFSWKWMIVTFAAGVLIGMVLIRISDMMTYYLVEGNL